MKLINSNSILSIGSTIILTASILIYWFLFIPLTPIQVLYLKCTNCTIGKEQAITDFKKGTYQIVTWGLPDTRYDTIVYPSDILESDYKIKTIRGNNCVSYYAIDCYTIKMYQLLSVKYGNDFVGASHRKAYQLNNVLKH
ncbi:hypothetical protein GM921_01880 [Pedobacter sp. LMG 31464]|uniref:Uncharacterized protein n=1 Tax=Pedobacter planticolens TaxID=2679964 RepID=A0A923IVM3_9SPHI|nr:hypothetical protein [Pedobacter planticolens]MBB2144222.1 hypothetical protein [Pedobacter planticolens]